MLWCGGKVTAALLFYVSWRPCLGTKTREQGRLAPGRCRGTVSLTVLEMSWIWLTVEKGCLEATEPCAALGVPVTDRETWGLITRVGFLRLL